MLGGIPFHFPSPLLVCVGPLLVTLTPRLGFEEVQRLDRGPMAQLWAVPVLLGPGVLVS